MRRLVFGFLLPISCLYGCNLEPDVAARLQADVQALKLQISQLAGGDINDSWSLRLLVLGVISSSVFLSILVYTLIVRPLRRRWEKKKR